MSTKATDSHGSVKPHGGVSTVVSDESAIDALYAVFGERFKVCRPSYAGDIWSIIERDRLHGRKRQSVIIGKGYTLAEALAQASITLPCAS